MTADTARTAFLIVAARARADEHGHVNLTDRDRAFAQDLLARLDRAGLQVAESLAPWAVSAGPPGLHAVPDPDGAR